MGKSILTPRQSQVVGLAKRTSEITRWYYFTGGTALAEVYLHHRYSDDLDFFTRSNVIREHIDRFIAGMQPALDYVEKKTLEISGLHQYTLMFADGETLKIDFNEYDFPQLEESPSWDCLPVDSLFDIAVNKCYTILSRSRARDFVDLYCCLPAIVCDIDTLIRRIPDKFPVSFEDLSIGDHLAKIVDLTDYPKMLIPFDRKKMIEYYLGEAKRIGDRLFR